jgi:hypothetical protein
MQLSSTSAERRLSCLRTVGFEGVSAPHRLLAAAEVRVSYRSRPFRIYPWDKSATLHSHDARKRASITFCKRFPLGRRLPHEANQLAITGYAAFAAS